MKRTKPAQIPLDEKIFALNMLNSALNALADKT